MSYSYRIFDSVEQVDASDWQCLASKYADRIFMDLRFIGAVEEGMRQSCVFRHVIVYDGKGHAAACASLCCMTIDTAALTDPRLRATIRFLSAFGINLRYLRIIICGMPVSIGQSHLVLVSRECAPEVLAILNAAAKNMATEYKAHGIAFKEYKRHDLAAMNGLLEFGYSRVPTPAMHCFEPRFADFDEYCAALRTKYRHSIRRSIEKLEQNDVKISILTETDDIVRAYTPTVHGLYYQVLDRSQQKLEKLPIEFFHQLSRRLAGIVELITLTKSSEIVGIAWALQSSQGYYILFAGVNYTLRSELDIYFNLLYASLSRALKGKPLVIQVGQTADYFKAKIGCVPDTRYAFIRGVGPLMSLIIRLAHPWLLYHGPNPPAFRIFKERAGH